jgi:predicted transcriptional regulator of viral defense system
MVLQTLDYQQQIRATIASHHGYITFRDLQEKKIPSYAFSYFLERQRLERLAKGFYAEKSWIKDEYFLFQYRYPKYVFSYQCALFLWGMSDRSPEHLEVSGPKNYRPLGRSKSEAIRHVVRQDELYSLGITNVQTIYGNPVRVYSPERTLLDLIKHRKETDPEIFVKALKAYEKKPDKDPKLFLDYAEKMGIREQAYDLWEIAIDS